MSDVLFAYGECAYIDVVAGTGCIHSMEATVANVGKRKVVPLLILVMTTKYSMETRATQGLLSALSFWRVSTCPQ